MAAISCNASTSLNVRRMQLVLCVGLCALVLGIISTACLSRACGSARNTGKPVIQRRLPHLPKRSTTFDAHGAAANAAAFDKWRRNPKLVARRQFEYGVYHRHPRLIEASAARSANFGTLSRKTESSQCFMDQNVCLNPANSPSGPACCGTLCVDTLTDRNNCGHCGHICKWSRSCCRGRCKNLNRDQKNCGTCNNYCPDGRCRFGMCSNY